MAGSPEASSASLTVATSCSPWNCAGERFTETEMHDGQVAASAQADLSAQAPMLTMSPLVSATSRKSMPESTAWSIAVPPSWMIAPVSRRCALARSVDAGIDLDAFAQFGDQRLGPFDGRQEARPHGFHQEHPALGRQRHDLRADTQIRHMAECLPPQPSAAIDHEHGRRALHGVGRHGARQSAVVGGRSMPTGKV